MTQHQAGLQDFFLGALGAREVWGPRSGRVRHRSHRIESTTVAIDLPVRKRTPAYEYAHFREVRRSVVSESGRANGCLALASHFGSASGARLTAGLTEDDDHYWGLRRSNWVLCAIIQG